MWLVSGKLIESIYTYTLLLLLLLLLYTTNYECTKHKENQISEGRYLPSVHLVYNIIMPYMVISYLQYCTMLCGVCVCVFVCAIMYCIMWYRQKGDRKDIYDVYAMHTIALPDMPIN